MRHSPFKICTPAGDIDIRTNHRTVSASIRISVKVPAMSTAEIIQYFPYHSHFTLSLLCHFSRPSHLSIPCSRWGRADSAISTPRTSCTCTCVLLCRKRRSRTYGIAGNRTNRSYSLLRPVPYTHFSSSNSSGLSWILPRTSISYPFGSRLLNHDNGDWFLSQ